MLPFSLDKNRHVELMDPGWLPKVRCLYHTSNSNGHAGAVLSAGAVFELFSERPTVEGVKGGPFFLHLKTCLWHNFILIAFRLLCLQVFTWKLIPLSLLHLGVPNLTLFGTVNRQPSCSDTGPLKEAFFHDVGMKVQLRSEVLMPDDSKDEWATLTDTSSFLSIIQPWWPDEEELFVPKTGPLTCNRT